MHWAEGNAESSLHKVKREPRTAEQQCAAQPAMQTAADVKFPEWQTCL